MGLKNMIFEAFSGSKEEVNEAVDSKMVKSLENELEQTKLVWKIDKFGHGAKHIRAIEIQLELAKKGWSESKIVNLGINSRNYEKFEKHLNESNEEEINEAKFDDSYYESDKKEITKNIDWFTKKYEKVKTAMGDDYRKDGYVSLAKREMELAKEGLKIEHIFDVVKKEFKL